jgi:type IV pilus assembly protein PilX
MQARKQLVHTRPGRVSRQRGVVLVVCLIFLAVLTLLAMAGMDGSVTEERMASNMQDYNQAFEAAEVAMDTAEDWLNVQLELPTKNGSGTAEVWTNNGPDPDSDSVNWWLERDSAWWTSNGDAVTGVNQVSAQPLYVIEEIFTSVEGQALGMGTGELPLSRVVHRITSRGTGSTANSEVILQSTYIRTYD